MRKIILTASDAKKQTAKTETKKLRRRIGELEAQLAAAIKWIQHDCPWDEETIRQTLLEDKP